MASNLFGQPSKNDIRVGYIDPQLGYVSDVSICEANKYAKINPGTTFLFKDGNKVLRYININEVNILTPSDLETNQKCEGVDQKKECGPPSIQIYGGGGIGAVGNPVIGTDGALLAVDLVSGGHGYQYSPQVTANDNCNYGSGTVLTAVIGEVSDGFETYTDDADFEEYELCDPNDAGFGRRYGPNGEDLGPWEPNVYTKIGADPIRTEVEKYERIVRRLARAPFWDTRRNRPTKIASNDARVTTNQVYKVTDATFLEKQRKDGVNNPVGWNEFMNTFAISPVSPSNVRGSDYAATVFTMEWNEEFPVTGEYIFRGLCDNSAKLYLDNQLVFDLGGFRDPVKDIRKTIKEGIHNIRVDLVNLPIYEKISQSVTTATEQPAGGYFWKKGNDYYLKVGGNDLVGLKLELAYNDSQFIAGTAITKVIIPTVEGNLVLEREKIGTTFKQKGSDIKKGLFKANQDYGPIVFEGRVSGSPQPQIANTGNPKKDPGTFQQRINFFDADGRDANASITLIPPPDQKSPNRVVNISTSSPLFPNSSGGIAVKKIFNTIDYINKANRTLWRTNVFGRGGFINEFGICPFDTTVTLKDNPYAGTHRIVWDNINFPVSGNYRIRLAVDDNVTLYVGDKVRIRKEGYRPGTSISTGELNESRFIEAGTYKIVADLEQIPGGKFGFDGGKNINPMALAVDIQVDVVEGITISPKSWNENPMGVSVTIDAPEPTVPQESVPAQEGRCPNNPIWTTRFPAKTERWFPVKFPGPRTITEIVTANTTTPTLEKKEVEFSVYGQGAFRDLSFVFTAVDGSHTFTLYGVDKNKKTRKDKVQINPNINYIVVAKEDSSKFNSVEQGLIKGGNKEKEQSTGTSNKIFADYTKTNNDNDDIQITAVSGTFTSSNRRKAKNSGRNTYDLIYRLNAAPTTKNNTTTSTRTFNAPGWSRFMNRYAISPVKPLDTPGSDKAGATYSTSWDVDIPYDGFYGVKGTRDNTGRILIDNNEISKLDGFNVDDPKLVKTFLTKGRHTITAEVYNTPIITESVIDQKIFSTKDWQVALTQTVSTEQPPGGYFWKKGGDYYLKVGGNDLVGLNIQLAYDDSQFIAGTAITKVIIPTIEGNLVLEREKTSSFFKEKGSVIKKGLFKANQDYGPIVFEGRVAGSRLPELANTGNPQKDPGTFQQRIKFFDADGNDANATLTLIPPPDQKSPNRTTDIPPQLPASRDGVTYEGPVLFHYRDSRWGSFMNDNSVSPYLPPLDRDNPDINGKKTYAWKNVKFPESGQYRVAFQADNIGSLYIGGTKVLSSASFIATPTFENVNISAGTYDVVVEVENIKDSTDIFNNNPTGFGVIIRKNVTIRDQNKTPWSSNPMGISAILVPPPCPKKISGRGVVKEVLVDDPGNGYLPPSSESKYPVSLRLKDVLVENPGINYNCGVDQIQITPSNGAVLDYVCDPFGKIREVKVLNPGLGFTEYPQIEIVTPAGGVPTGINASFKPQFEVVRDPIVTLPEKLIQVTDLVGLKQNGYIEGRAYYGSVFYKDGIRYAGFYETPGDLVQVYDTLQESIAATVTATPSAIQKSGTDTELSSNNPRLNIPGTPENLI
jgi:hypothetical protein